MFVSFSIISTSTTAYENQIGGQLVHPNFKARITEFSLGTFADY
jgi:hypothetical protein